MSARRIAILGAAVVLMTAVLLVYGTTASLGQSTQPINVSGEVDSSQCAPCHMRIAEGKRPGLIFYHGNHLIVACSACHIGMPHEGGKTTPPPMEVCFNCHGLKHGDRGLLATAKCRDCHTRSFQLRPKTHTRNWWRAPHAQTARRDVNRCMMCHEAVKDCDTCHRRKNVRVGGKPIAAMPKGYHPVLKQRPQRPAVIVFPDAPTSMSQCIHCHPDIDAFMPGRIIFEHAEHLRRNYPCEACHPQFGHAGEKVRRPDMQSCYRCHGLKHANAGLIATEDCDKCHPKGFQLKPPDHTKKFEAGAHKVRAYKDASYCSMCHQSEWCVKCHNGLVKPKKGQPKPKKVIPANHRKADWRGVHGKQFMQQKGLCGSCHDAKFCKKCHKTPMPHPTTWLSNHKVEGEANQKDCNICHTDRESCQQCHHDTVRRAKLTTENCTKCHEEMLQKPATKIKNKGFAEHAVHFEVFKKKGKPYNCYDCHVGFGTSRAARQLDVQQAHDLRLCYDCHGNLDYKNQLIAPYQGAGLCRRCHTDLNI